MDAILVRLVDAVAGLPLPVVLAAALLFAAAEVSVGLGILVPGETGVLALAALSTGWPQATALAAAIAAGGVLGDSAGYWLGRRYGDRLLDTRVGRRIGAGVWQRAAAVLRRRGPAAVFGARYVAVLRAVVPAAAGAARLPYRQFLIGSVAGACSWAVVHVAVGVAVGASFRTAARYFGTGGWLLFAIIAAVGAAVVLHRRRRQPGHRAAAPPPAGERRAAAVSRTRPQEHS